MRRRGGAGKVRGRPAPVVVAALVAAVALAALAVAGPLVWGDNAEAADGAALLQGPSRAHLFGTDALGRDILSRVLVATRLSVGLAALAILIGVAIGVPLGAATAVLGRRAARTLAAAVDLLVAFPALLAALFFAVIFGVGARGAVLAIGLASAPAFARLTMTLTSRVAGSDYFAAARILGVGRTRLVLRHVLPNIGEPLVINATIAIGQALVILSGLSFLGLGVQPPDYDWGRMLNEGLERIYGSVLPALAPGLAIVLAGLTFNLCGEALASVLSGRSGRTRRRATSPEVSAAAVPASSAVQATGTPGPGPERVVDEVLHVEHLSVRFPGAPVDVVPVRDVSFTVQAGEVVGILGESGSGKSLSVLAAARLTVPPAQVRADAIRFLGTELTEISDDAARRLLGTSLAMVFQDPATTLNPALRVGTQLVEPATVHERMPPPVARAEAARRLQSVQLSEPQRILRAFPHQLSGGMRQRAVIAMGLLVTPRLIIADEPTTALDVTVQEQILQLIRELNDTSGAGAVLISHDIGAVAEICDRVLVMYCGRIVEELRRDQLVDGAAHPYTRALVGSLPRLTTDRDQPLASVPGQPPVPVEGMVGCPFAPRCAVATRECEQADPPLRELAGGHRVACWHPQGEPGTAATTRAPVAEAGQT